MILLMFEGFQETLVHIGGYVCHMNKAFTFGRKHELSNLSTPARRQYFCFTSRLEWEHLFRKRKYCIFQHDFTNNHHWLTYRNSRVLCDVCSACHFRGSSLNRHLISIIDKNRVRCLSTTSLQPAWSVSHTVLKKVWFTRGKHLTGFLRINWPNTFD